MLTNTHIDLSLYDLSHNLRFMQLAIACQSYCIVVTYIRLTLIPGFCTGARTRTSTVGFGDRNSTIKLLQYIKARKFASYGLEKPRLYEDCITTWGFTSCCVASYGFSRYPTLFIRLTITSQFRDYIIRRSRHLLITYPDPYLEACSRLCKIGNFPCSQRSLRFVD